MNGAAELVRLPSVAPSLSARVDALPWQRIATGLDAEGWAATGPLLAAAECAELASSYAERGLFRSRVVMARHGFGQGEYQYFAYPLPAVVAELRAAIYPHLAAVANEWAARLGRGPSFPGTLDEQLRACHAAGQRKPTPLLLSYGPGDFNCLHQDLYGEQVFPLQLTVLLSRPGDDFTGGEFVLVEQRPRQQSRPQVVRLAQGEAVIFAVRERPARGARGFHRVTLRHGVSRVEAGRRLTLGVIFHDAA